MRLRKQIFNAYTFILFFAMPVILLGVYTVPRLLNFIMHDREYALWVWNANSYEAFHLGAFGPMQIILPLMPMFGVGYFYSLKRGFLGNAAVRTGNYKKFAWKLILQSVFICAAVMYISYFITACAGAALFTGTVNLGSSQRGLFTEFFGEMFSKENPYLYGLLEGVYRYIAFPAVYALFGIAVSYCSQKPYMPILAPFVYYCVFALVSSYLKFSFPSMTAVFRVIDTSATLTGGSELKMLFFVPFIPLIIPAVFSVLTINRKLKEDM